MPILANKWTRFIFGSPLSRDDQVSERLPKFKALAILSSDALSSVAYATEEILGALMVAGAAALGYVVHVSIFIVILIVIVGVSYRQAIAAYPKGGGAYTVARENLGTVFGLVAAGSLMIDYVLTVAVSVSAGIYAITSAFPHLAPHAVLLSVLAVIIVMWMNLRGVREAATAFTWPTYLFIGMVFLLLIVGGYRYFTGTIHPIVYPASEAVPATTSALTMLLLLRAFSSGCSAMTGIEVISNGVTTFKEPAPSNAMITLLYLVGLLIVMFLGLSTLALALHVHPLMDNSVLSQIGQALLGHSVFYYLLQFATCLILLLAANSSFAGFPLLASIISSHSYLPRQLQDVGDRLAFSNGIILLGVLAIILIVMFDARTDLLIPLYSIGVFVAFTLCQAGLVKVWWRRRVRYWWAKASINAIGCVATAVASIVIAESKFTEGAWIFFVALPLLMWMFYSINKHYRLSDKELAMSIAYVPEEITALRPKVAVPVSMIHKGTLAALELAHRLSDDVTAIAINTNPARTQKLRDDWERLKLPYKLVVLDSPYQSMLEPLLTRIRRMDITEPERGLTTVVVTRAMPSKWWHFLLHNHRVLLLRLGLAIIGRENKGSMRVIIEIPYQLRY